MTRRRVLVVTGDHRLADSTKWDGAYSDDDLELHQAMCDALASLGRWDVDVCCDHAQLVDRLQNPPPDLMFNLCDTGFRNVATQELHVPALAEMLGVPYSGAPPAAMVLAYDKSIVNMLAGSLDIPVPHERLFHPDTTTDRLDIVYPAFVKPAQGDGSVGINRRAIVRSDVELREQLAWFRGEFPQRTALVQEYLSGPEYGLALIGNPGDLHPLPVLEVDYSRLPRSLPPILAFESKTGPENPYNRVAIARAGLARTVVDELVAAAARLFKRIGCRDYARFDFRTAEDGTIKLMEINPNPAWSREAKLAIMAGFEGLTYPALLERLVDTAFARLRP